VRKQVTSNRITRPYPNFLFHDRGGTPSFPPVVLARANQSVPDVQRRSAQLVGRPPAIYAGNTVTVSRHNVQVSGADLFGVAARLELSTRLPELPMHSREAVEQELATLDFLETQIESAEQRLEAIMKVSVEADVLQTLPCVGKVLSMVLMLEIGRVDRFPTAAHLASYAGLVPRVHSSGGRTRMGQVSGNVNRNLKWAFVETGNLIVINQRRLAGSHVARLYQRIKRSKNHQKAVVAVARHLAEAAWWVLTKLEVYREPQGRRHQALSSTHG
jgi:transposase